VYILQVRGLAWGMLLLEIDKTESGNQMLYHGKATKKNQGLEWVQMKAILIEKHFSIALLV